ncbi:hypothetical protein CsatA_015664 [Cannabis sativa]
MSLPARGRRGVQLFDETKDGLYSFCDLGSSQWNFQDGFHHLGGLFASVGKGLGVSPNPRADGGGGGGGMKLSYTDFYMKFMEGIRRFGGQEEDGLTKKKKKNKLKIKVSNPSLHRLISGAIAGAVSRTAVAPLETIRTHLMAIELFAYDTVNKHLTPKLGEQAKHPIPPSLIAGACVGVSSTLCTYPLELLKTRLTIQRGVYDGLFDAFLKILREEGPAELYRGLAPSLIGVIPYAATNYFAYDSLRRAYRNFLKQDNKIGNIETLLIGSAAGAISSTATFPLEAARKHMQVGALSGRQVYKNVIHALACIIEHEGIPGLYRGLGPSCMKLVPAGGISFMCYEACKRILVEINDEET